MSTQNFNLPDVGEGLTEAEIVAWKVAPGDTVAINDVVCEIETAKSLVELPSPHAGVVGELLVEEGATVEVGTPIITFVTEPAAGAPAAPAPAAPAAEEGGGSVLVGYGTGGGATSRRKRPAERPVRSSVGVIAKPPIRKLARDLGVDLTTVAATGADGEVTRDDVMKHASQASVFRNIETPEWGAVREETVPAPQAAPAGLARGLTATRPSAAGDDRTESIPVKGVRKATSSAMVQSAYSAPHVTVWKEIDASRTMELVKRLKASPDYADIRVSPLLIMARAVIWAARRTPMVNAASLKRFSPSTKREMMTSPSSTPVLELSAVTKAFGAVVALRSATISVDAGSIHALVGENGAGKSTLVKIVAGLYQRDAGDFRLRGEEVDFTSTAQSKAAGVAVIYQEPTLFPDLSVTENIFMGRQPTNRFGRIDRKAMRHEVERLFTRLGVGIDPDRPAEGLSIADQQVIEIAKAVSLDASLLIMDEPTAALSGVEVERLFAIARSLRDEGRGLIFISHRFDEVFDLCDVVTVMRDGAYISTSSIATTTVDEIVHQMVGREVTELFPKQETTIGEPLLEVEGLTSPGIFHDISFTVRSGEIVGLAGLVGAGRSEVARAVFGVDGYRQGVVRMKGRRIPGRRPVEAMRAGLALVPEDRRRQGLVIEAGVGGNITLAIRRRLAKLGLITTAVENRSAREWASRLEVKTHALDTVAATLSGGNQQKVVLAKWLATQPQVLLIDEPTRGIDVGTKSEVHRLLSELAGQGMGILMISSELPEVLGMADHVLVMREGRITAEITRSEATSENVMFAATHASELSS